MSGEWVVCPLDEAEGFRAGGKLFTMETNTAWRGQSEIGLRLHFDRWVTLQYDDFKLFGIEPVKFVKPEPMEYVGKVEQIDRYMGKDFEGDPVIVPFFAVMVPPKFAGEKVKVIEVLE